MSGHTPGPWEAWRGDVWSQSDLLVAIINRAKEVGNGRANARLIAAAPDLLAVLQGALGLLETHPEGEEATRAAIDAITKATKP